MKLGEKLKALKPAESVITIDGNRYRVVGLLGSKKADLLSQSRDKKGSFIPGKADGLFLSACVRDEESGEQFFSEDEWAEWGSVPGSITGPLMAECMKVCGVDNDDVGREVKNSVTTAGSV
jgi:hypothetical protein